MLSIFAIVLIQTPNTPKRPSQNDFGSGVCPNGPTGNQLRSSGCASAPPKKTARKIMSRFTSAATN
jgi:hypothetical protein